MKTDQSAAGAYQRGALAQWLSLALVSLLVSLPATLFVRLSGASSRPGLGAQGQSGPTAIGTIFTVNSTGDGAIGCGTGQQCSLRAAINAANTHAGDDGIVFSIPLTDPGCDAATGRCVINLGSVLPDLSTNIAINGPGADKLTVRRNAAANFRIFHVTTAGVANISGLTISNGSDESGGGIQNENGGSVNVSGCTLSDNVAAIQAQGGAVFNASPCRLRERRQQHDHSQHRGRHQQLRLGGHKQQLDQQ